VDDEREQSEQLQAQTDDLMKEAIGLLRIAQTLGDAAVEHEARLGYHVDDIEDDSTRTKLLRIMPRAKDALMATGLAEWRFPANTSNLTPLQKRYSVGTTPGTHRAAAPPPASARRPSLHSRWEEGSAAACIAADPSEQGVDSEGICSKEKTTMPFTPGCEIDQRGVVLDGPDQGFCQRRLDARRFLPWQLRPNRERPKHMRAHASHRRANSPRQSGRRHRATRSASRSAKAVASGGG